MRRLSSLLFVAAALPGGGFAFAQAMERARTPDPTPPIVVSRDPQEARCQRLVREFAVSSACYSRFRTTKGIKAEGFERCGPPVPDPRGNECPIKR